MGFFARLRFLLGLLFIVGIVAALFLLLNYAMSNKSSHKATLETDAYVIKSEYGGVLRRQFVTPGDEVKEGDQLFEISSPSLTDALKNDRANEDSLLFEVASNGNMILLANAPGVVQQINYTDGSYIEVNTDIATIATQNARYVVAYYLLNAPDYARINRDNPIKVTLPDNKRFEAKVFDINLEQDGEQVFTVVRARLPENASILPTFTSGTPVSTTWQLDNSDWQVRLFDFVRQLTEPRA